MSIEDDLVVVRLDEVQVLRLHAVTTKVDGRALRITIGDGYLEWTSYGGTDRHREQLEAGGVEFHPPFYR